jgi:hypothetical protein
LIGTRRQTGWANSIRADVRVLLKQIAGQVREERTALESKQVATACALIAEALSELQGVNLAHWWIDQHCHAKAGDPAAFWRAKLLSTFVPMEDRILPLATALDCLTDPFTDSDLLIVPPEPSDHTSILSWLEDEPAA